MGLGADQYRRSEICFAEVSHGRLQAMAVADILLGKRSKKCTQGFYDILDKNGCPVEPSEKAKFFWSPKLPANASDSDREVVATPPAPPCAASDRGGCRGGKGRGLERMSCPEWSPGGGDDVHEARGMS